MAAAKPSSPVTVPDFLAAKGNGRRLAVLTAYDHTTARLLDAAGVDCLLVGDSLGMVVQGQPDALAVTLDEMVYHTRLVARGCRHALVVGDMPFGSYQASPDDAVRSAIRLVKDGAAQAVKLESATGITHVVVEQIISRQAALDPHIYPPALRRS